MKRLLTTHSEGENKTKMETCWQGWEMHELKKRIPVEVTPMGYTYNLKNLVDGVPQRKKIQIQRVEYNQALGPSMDQGPAIP